jgi:hypothetical protein
MDDEPIEYELDSEKDPSIAVVYFMADGTCEYISEYPVTCEVIDYESIPDRVHYSFEQPRWHVQVSFQPDKERMIQAARDKLAAWRAREAGL